MRFPPAMQTMPKLVALCCAFLVAACGDADPAEGADAGVTSGSQALMICGDPRGCGPVVDVDCRLKSSASCYECGNKNGVMCCLTSAPCTVVK